MIVTEPIKQKVESVLGTHMQARSNDKKLILEVWKKEGLPINWEFEQAFLGRDVSSPESVRRTRQKLQESGQYLAPKPVREARAKLEQETRQEMTQGSLL